MPHPPKARQRYAAARPTGPAACPAPGAGTRHDGVEIKTDTTWRAVDGPHLVTYTTRVALTPETGRTHQLRVHMQSLGHPILGDTLYATEEALAKADRLLLHAEFLSFAHPETGEVLSFNCPAEF